MQENHRGEAAARVRARASKESDPAHVSSVEKKTTRKYEEEEREREDVDSEIDAEECASLTLSRTCTSCPKRSFTFSFSSL